ncbi:hypothetical protein K3495_g16426 [Podosphaera aphanis]|nr:hypothetical protein K3495_g16426 [Podosphaera aphanis]
MLALGFTIPSAAAPRRCALVAVPFATTENAANFVVALTAWGHTLQTTLTALSALALSRANLFILQKNRLQNSVHVTVIISGNSVARELPLPLLPPPQLLPLPEAPAHLLSRRNPPVRTQRTPSASQNRFSALSSALDGSMEVDLDEQVSNNISNSTSHEQ